VTCPACGLANEPGARVCRNCGLPIASAGDPLRGVKPGRVDLPSAQRSGLSATVGLALVVGLLLVGGTLAVSGGGILNSGGRLVDSGGDASPAALVEGIRACPEVELEADLDLDDEADLETAFSILALPWHVLGVTDRDERLTALGAWILPRALARAWGSDFDAGAGG